MSILRIGVLCGLFCLFLGQAAWALPDAKPKVSNAAVAEQEVAQLVVANRPITEFRSSFLGETAQARAIRAQYVIREILQASDQLQVSLQSSDDNFIVMLGEHRAFVVTPGDANMLGGDTAQSVAKVAVERLQQVVAETAESRDLQMMLKATAYSLAATLIFFLLIKLITLLRDKCLIYLPGALRSVVRLFRLGKTQILDDAYLLAPVLRIGRIFRWALLLLLTYEWLSFVLSRFPYTRPWGEHLNTYMVDVAVYLLDGMVGAIPGIAVAIAIYFIARSFSIFSRQLLKQMASQANPMNWLNPQTLPTTTRLTSLAIWLFALAMAYPYLPGAQTEAFKGLSVLLGLMVSLGASGVIGQAVSGLILTYTHTLRPGEYVRIGEHEGTVTEMGMFTTRIRTGLGELLSIPNSMITGAVTKNYSRTVQGDGYVVDTTVTIGYDTPWRQVEAMLVEAARRTSGISSTPAPCVFQTALSDFYPEYRLVAQAEPSQPRPRAKLLSELHANIQDVFNEYGVQIMSPHYEKDPQEPKVVAKSDWYQAPAEKP